MPKLHERRLALASGGLTLEAALHEGEAALAAVVLHPHPQYGGDMDNHVVLGLCEALAGAGATVMRFNFRGTGRSEGAYDGGRGEADDARAALASVRDLRPDARMVLAGYSFGAMVAAQVAQDDGDLAGLVLVSPPVGMIDLPAPPASLPALLITGDADHIAPPQALQKYANDAPRVVAVAGADHGWWPGLDRLAEEVAAFVARVTRGAAP